METLKQLKKLRLSSMMFLLLMAFGCSTDNTDPVIPSEDISPEATEDATAMISHLRQVNQDGPIYLSGVQKYYTCAVKSKEILQGKDDPGVPCDVILTFLEGHSFQLNIVEHFPPEYGGDRYGEFIGTITPSGRIKFSFPSPLAILPDGSPLYITDIMSEFTGCEFYGPGINKGTLVYQGYFDGERLLVSAPFYSKCEVEWPLNELFDTPVDGPLHWRRTIDVTVD